MEQDEFEPSSDFITVGKSLESVKEFKNVADRSEPDNKLGAAWDTFLIEAGVFPEIIVETDDLDLAKQLAIEGHGVTVAPRWSVLEEIAEKKGR